MHANTCLLANRLIKHVYHRVFRSRPSETNALSVDYLLRLTEERVALRSIQVGQLLDLVYQRRCIVRL